MTLTRLQTLNEAMAADEGSRAKEAFSEAVGIITIHKQKQFSTGFVVLCFTLEVFANLMQIDKGW